jgi:hypothetical protein
MNAAKAIGRSQIILIIDGEAKSSGMCPLDSKNAMPGTFFPNPEPPGKP